MEVTVVEFLKPLKHGHRHILPGTRLLAWKGPAGWTVIFNGAQILTPPGTVAELSSSEVKAAVEQRASARDEEYQTAKP
jgi:hypothetical protein